MRSGPPERRIGRVRITATEGEEMSNLNVNQMNQYERATFSEPTLIRRVTPRGRRILAISSFVFAGILGVLTYAAVTVFNGWPHLIVIADLLILVYGVAQWVDPNRKRIY
jgi:hypothetical protein